MTNCPVTFTNGLIIPSLRLTLDGTKRAPLGFISHAHTDHIASHGCIITSQLNWPFVTDRLVTSQRRRSSDAFLLQPTLCDEIPSVTQHFLLPFMKRCMLQDHEFQLLPSGHIWGAAQLLIGFPDGELLLYTGDLKLRPRPTAQQAVLTKAKYLIIESTFGKPHYCFPSWEEIQSTICQRARVLLASGILPIFTVYPLGKAQEVTRALSDGGIPVTVHPEIARYHRIYEQQGCTLGSWHLLNEMRPKETAVLVPQRYGRTQLERLLAKHGIVDQFHTIFLSGWAVDGHAASRCGTHEALPLSDHADWRELLEVVEIVNPQRVYTVHGFPDLAIYLRSQGIEASHHGSNL
jgi:Cft2 family RNA processing exonuclease